MTYDSNVGRSETNPQSDLIKTGILGLNYRENTADVTARLLAQVERRQYTRQTFNNDTSGILDGAALWNIRPRSLSWTLEDVFREVLIDVRAPDSPSNRTNANVLNTGPDFTLRLSAANSAVLGARYGRNDVENSNTDTRRYNGYIRGLHTVSTQTTVSLNYEAGRIYFEPGAQAFLSIDRQDLFGSLVNDTVKTTTAIDLGASRATPYGGLASCTPTVRPGPPACLGTNLQTTRLVRISFADRLAVSSTVRVTYSDQFSDTYTDLLAALAGSALPTDPRILAPTGTPASFVTADLYHSKQGSISYANNSGQFVYNLYAYLRRVDFETLPQDFHEGYADLSWTWLRSDAMSLNASALFRDRVFDSFAREDRDVGFRVSGLLKLNRSLTITLTADHTERHSTEALQSYLDNRVMLLFGLTTGSAYQIQPRRY
jgi:hypothetical protein